MLNYIKKDEDTLTIQGNLVKLPNKNQIYLNDLGTDSAWVLEMYEGTNEYTGSGEELFSVFDAYETLEEAIRVGSRLTPRNYQRLRDEALNAGEKSN